MVLCPSCLKYHSMYEFCKKTLIECQYCGHKQMTLKKNISEKKCSVCNKYKMELMKNV